MKALILLLNDTDEDWDTLIAQIRLIRGESHTVLKAIQRQLTHQAYRVGQIVFLAKDFRSTDWQTLSIPRGKTEKFNTTMRRKFAARKV